MPSHLRMWWGAAAALLLTVGLTSVDLADRPFRHWWVERPFTATVLGGLLVLLDTSLIVDRVVQARRVKERSLAVAAQAAIVVSQAARTSRAVQSALEAGGDHEVAADEMKAYMSMLLTAAPTLIDAQFSRRFLEDAQALGARLGYSLAAAAGRAWAGTGHVADRERAAQELRGAVEQLRASSVPLLRILDPDQRLAVTVEDIPFLNEPAG